MKVSAKFPGLTLVFLLLSLSFGHNEQNVAGIEVERINDSFYLLATGNPGDSTILLNVGEDGALLIDSHYSVNHGSFDEAISHITDEPVQFIINTHWHPDHVGANGQFNRTGAQIFAHDSVRDRMQAGGVVEFFQSEVEPYPDEALPQVTFDSELTLHFNGEAIHAFFTAPAHTDGDIVVYFPGANIVHMGDAFINLGYPFLDTSNGGGVDGNVQIFDRVLSLIDEDTIVVPGHGPLSDRQELQDYRDMFVAVRDSVREAVDAGMTLEGTIASAPTAEFDERYSVVPFTGEAFVTALYELLGQSRASR